MSNNVNSVLQRSVSCYFCNEFLEEKYLADHVKHCSAVLEECPNKCGAYVPRRCLQEHDEQCFGKRTKKNSQSKESHAQLSSDSAWREKVFSILNLLRATINDGEQERRRLEESLTSNWRILQSKQEVFEISQLDILKGMEETRQVINAMEKRLSNLEQVYNDVDQRISLSFKQVANQLELLQSKLVIENSKHDKAIDKWHDELNDFKTFLAKENIMISGVWHEQLKHIHDLKLELEMRCKSSKELSDGHDVLSEKINILVEEIRKYSEATMRQATEIKTLKFQIKDNVRHIEDIIKDDMRRDDRRDIQCRCTYGDSGYVSTNGRFLWRIDRYKEKMTDAKENDVVIYSPLFYNKEYGYALKVELYLNGRGQWKGRHIIGCLRVVDGEWDPLLDWPCVLQASITLRDQENPANDIRKIVKAVRKERSGDSQNVEKESGMYMFIPHSKLTRYSGYTRNNVLFLDCQLRNLKTCVSTPSLLE